MRSLRELEQTHRNFLQHMGHDGVRGGSLLKGNITLRAVVDDKRIFCFRGDFTEGNKSEEVFADSEETTRDAPGQLAALHRTSANRRKSASTALNSEGDELTRTVRILHTSPGFYKNDFTFISTALTFVFCCGGRKAARTNGSPQQPQRLQEAPADFWLGSEPPPGVRPSGGPVPTPPTRSPRPGEGPPPRSRWARPGPGGCRTPAGEAPSLQTDLLSGPRAEWIHRAASPVPGSGRRARDAPASGCHRPFRRRRSPSPRRPGRSAID